MARGLRWLDDDRRRRSYLLFPLHAFAGPLGRLPPLLLDEHYNLIGYPPQYMASQVITKEWVQPIDAPHKLFKVSSDVTDAAGTLLVTAYAVERPDGQWSVMLVNRDQYNQHAVKVVFHDPETGRDRHFSGQVDRITFGSAEYKWHQEENAATRIPTAHPPARRYAAAQKRFTSSRWHRLQYFAVPSAINQAHLRAFIAICPRTLRDDCEAHFLDRIPSVYFDGFHNVTYKEEWKLPVHGPELAPMPNEYEKDFTNR